MSTRIIRGTGAFLLVFALADMATLLVHYGPSQGFYAWFYHAACLLLGIALVFQHRVLALGTIAASAIPLAVYFVEHLLRILGFRVLGMTDFLYHPGMGNAQFVLGHVHLFFWPAAVLAWWWLPVTKKESKRVTPIFLTAFAIQGVLWALSLFVFPFHQNVNCAYGPCFSIPFQMGEVTYRIVYFGGLLFLSFLLAHALVKFSAKLSRGKKTLRTFGRTCGGFAALLAILTAADWYRWHKLPHFNCAQAYEDSEVRASCDYTVEWAPGQMMLSYSVVNKKNYPRFCFSRIEMDGKEEALHDSIWAEPNQSTEIWVVVPHPKKETSARLIARCED